MAEAESPAFVQQMVIPPAPNVKRGGLLNMDTSVEGKLPARLAYGSGKFVWIREIANPNNGYSYRGHINPVQCVRFNIGAGIRDSGWVASGDTGGNIRTWTCRADEPTTRLDLQMGKCTRDLAWMEDLKKLLIVGEGKKVEDMGKLADCDRGGGNQFGICEGMSKQINSCDFTKAKRFGNKIPNYAVACDEVGNLAVYMLKSGKIAKKVPRITDMAQFTAVRIRPGDLYFACCGKKKVKRKNVSMLRVFKFNDYKTETAEVAMVENCHEGTVSGLSWNDDGSQIVTCGFDKTLRVWNFVVNEDGSCELTPSTVITVGKEIVDMQCGIVWQGDTIISASVSGELNFCDPNKDIPVAQHAGHHTCSALVLAPGDERVVYSIGNLGLLESNMDTGASRKFKGDGHGKGKAFSRIGVSCDGKTVVTAGMSDTILWHGVSEVATADEKTAYETGGQVKFLCCGRKDPSLVVIGCSRTGIHVLKDGKCVDKALPDKNELYVRSGDLSSDDSKVLLVGYRNHETVVYLYSISEDGKLTLVKEQRRGQHDAQFIKWFIDDQHYYLGSDGNNACALYDSDSDSKTRASKDSLCLHTGVANNVAFTPSGGMYTVGADSAVIYFPEPMVSANNHTKMRHCHDSGVVAVVAADDNTFITCGEDGAIKMWKRS